MPDFAEPVWHLFVVRSAARGHLISRLDEHRIETLIHYPIPPHRQAAYAEESTRIPPQLVAERLANEVLSLPIHPFQKHEQTRQVVAALSSALQ